jgi:uncharacterized protein (TIGR02266 family)
MTALNKQLSRSNVRGRLFALIKGMPEDEQMTLLKELEERLFRAKRRHHRKTFSMIVDYATEGRAYKDYIENISAGGVFIETRTPFAVGQEVSLSFPLPNHEKYIRITGEVVRTSQQGIGVKFKLVDKDQEAMIDSLLEMI